MQKKDKTAVAKQPDSKNKTDKEAKTDSKNKTDKAFIQAADQIDLAEMKLGKVAEKNGASDAVKKFGVRTAHDHSLMNKELREITNKQEIAFAERVGCEASNVDG